MGRKVDAQLIKLENKVKFIEENLNHSIQIQETIIKKHLANMIQMRDLLTKLIEGR